ncbi:hypothetical protein ON003_02305 [Janibacter hoylei]|uniref:hypothetical protein n=1 Tax=Janibacter hoylei TaxID=364298 RepID=UPI0022383E12|nr:hypothetical protein [Janibacter hoylei]MCW4600566.1 hypothetical protein [Janibacter hoylei]
MSTRLAASGEPVAVFPWSTYRRYAWNDDRVVLDPWNRLLPQTVVSDDRLPLRDRTVAGEDRASDEVTRALAQDPADVVPVLRALGVRWVVVQTDQPSPAGSVPDLDGVPVQRVGDLRVADLGAPQQVDVEPDRLRGLGLVGTGLAVVLALGLVVRHRRT